MPIYEYQCVECEHIEEVIQKVSDEPLLECPACNKPALKKKVTAAGFRLSGGGWYETDFKSGDKKNLTESAAGKAKDSADKPAAKTEKAADTKTTKSSDAA